MLSRAFVPNDSSGLDRNTPRYDITIVFGEGPVKPLLLEEEMTSEQKTQWDEYKTDPFKKPEPDFYVIERHMPPDIFDAAHVHYWNRLQTIRNDLDLSDERRMKEVRQLLYRWQRWGRFSLRRMGKQNAIAAGVALLAGMTREIIITGGKTMPEWKREELKHQFRMMFPEFADSEAHEFEKHFTLFLKYSVLWPSEAEIMADMIVHNFGEAYEQRFGVPITTVIRLETEARNTLENVTLTVNKFPEVTDPEVKVGLLSADHHVQRIGLLAHRFNIVNTPGVPLSAQKMLHGMAADHEARILQEVIHYYMSPLNPTIADVTAREARWIQGLTDPDYVTYWLGYTFEIEDPAIVMDVLRQFHDGGWTMEMEKAFSDVGIDFHGFTAMDLERLARENPVAYDRLREKMMQLTDPARRKTPPA